MLPRVSLEIVRTPDSTGATPKARAEEAAVKLGERIEQVQARITRETRAVDVVQKVFVQELFGEFLIVVQVANGSHWTEDTIRREVETELFALGYGDVSFYVSGWVKSQRPSVTF